MAAVSPGPRAHATGIQRLVAALAVLVVLGVAGTNIRLVVQYMADSRIVGASSAAPAALPGQTARPAQAVDNAVLLRLVARLRAGDIKLAGEPRAAVIDRLRNDVIGGGAGDDTAAVEALLQLPMAVLLAPADGRRAAAAAPGSSGERGQGADLSAPAISKVVGGVLQSPRPEEIGPPPRVVRREWFAEVRRVEGWEEEAHVAARRAPAVLPTLDDALARVPKPNGTVIATFVNLKRLDFGLTWVSRCHKLGLPNFVVGALDPQALASLLARGVATFQMGATAKRAPLPGASDYGWNSPNFKKMGVEKVQLLADLLNRNLSALLLDADAVLVRDPLPFFANYPEADVLVTTDYIGAPATDGGIDPARNLQYTMNIGVIFARPEAAGLAREWLRRLSGQQLRWDQNVFFELMTLRRDGAGFADRLPDRPGLTSRLTPAMRDRRLGLAFGGSIVAGVLPTSLFCTGFTFVSGYCDRNERLRPFTFHACWLFYEALGKRVRLRSLRLWLDERAYYERGEGDRDNGFLVLSDGGWLGQEGASSELLRPPFTIEKHMRLVHEQLRYVRSAMLLAAMLRRQLVMPRIYCLYDKWWAEHNGTIPYSVMDQPIKDCPMDHILELNVLDRHQQWLPRQHTFLQHEDLPEAVNSSRAEVSLREVRDMPRPPEGQSALGALLDALSPPDGRPVPPGHPGTARVLGVRDLPDVLHMMHPDDQDKFMHFARRFTSLMCCTWSPKLNGHIHYDLFWDVVPHTDTFGRTFTREWVPLFAETRQRISDCRFDFKRGRDPSHPAISCGHDTQPI